MKNKRRKIIKSRFPILRRNVWNIGMNAKTRFFGLFPVHADLRKKDKDIKFATCPSEMAIFY